MTKFPKFNYKEKFTATKANNFQSKLANYILLALHNRLKRSEIYSNRWIYGI